MRHDSLPSVCCRNTQTAVSQLTSWHIICRISLQKRKQPSRQQDKRPRLSISCGNVVRYKQDFLLCLFSIPLSIHMEKVSLCGTFSFLPTSQGPPIITKHRNVSAVSDRDTFTEEIIREREGSLCQTNHIETTSWGKSTSPVTDKWVHNSIILYRIITRHAKRN